MSRKFRRFVALEMVFLLASSCIFGNTKIFAQSSNIALKKDVYAVSTKNSTQTSNVTDGNHETIWESDNDWNRWVEIDLNGTYEISEINVFTPVNEVTTFNVYVSNDNVNFNKVAEQLNEAKATDKGYLLSFEPVTATKVRVAITHNSQRNTAKLNEVEINGKKISDDIPEVKNISTADFDETDWGKRYESRMADKNVLNREVIEESKALVNRVLGDGYSSQFSFVVQEVGINGKDAFMVEKDDKKIKIIGPNGISLAAGFNWYLKNIAHLNYDPLCVSNLNVPEILPLPETKVAKETPYEYKYALNFCTFSYTMAFWGWEEYEAFIDWCAMNGINLMLDVLGQEEVQRRTLNRFGYNDQEIKEYLTGPGYYAWFYMANMQSFGGPLPDSWFIQRTELARKVHDRMSIFGIQPVFLGYAGQVPNDFKEKNPDALILDQGGWSGFSRPPMLRTYVEDDQVDYFSKVADVYYEEMNNTFGNITDFYAVDPFHEGGKPGNLSMTKVAQTVQNKMREHNEDAIWVIQNWQSNPTNQFIQGLDKEKSLILDLYADNQPNHFNRNEYDGGSGEGTPWIWNMLHSFGGRMGFNGMPEILANIPEDLSKSEHMAGIGVTAESLGTNPLLYEMIYDMGWEINDVNVQNYISNYFLSRYGVKSDNIENAWDIMVDTAYFKRRDRQRAEDSIINARPGFGVTKACIYYTAEIDYDKAQFEEILALYLKEYDNLKNNQAYLYDLADISRQVLANASYEYYRAFEDAWLAKDYETFKEMANKFIEIVELQDRVLSTQDEFLVGKWIDNARNLLDGSDDWTKDLFEFNARAQISTWGGKNAANSGGLHDYSNRQWNGITGTLYKERWQTWIDKLDDAAKNKDWARPSVSADQWFEIEYKWANISGNEFAVTASDENLNELGQLALKQYSVTQILKTSKVEQGVNLALNKPTLTDGKAVRPTANAVDGNTDTLWVNQSYPASIEVDLQGIYSIDGIDLYFERPAEDMSNPVVFAYKIEVMDENGDWQMVVDESQNIEVKSYVIKAAYQGKAQKVRVTIPTADLELRPLVKPGCSEIYVWQANEIEVGMKNKALEGTASASKTAANPERSASKVNDGNLDTFWAAGTGQFPQWVQVDLGKAQDIYKLMIGFEKELNDFKYQIDLYADDGNTIIGTINQNEEVQKPKKNIFEQEYRNVRFIRVTINGVINGSQAWPAVAEIEAYGKQNNLLADEKIKVSGTNEEQIPNLFDGDLETAWNASEENKEIIVDLGHIYELDHTYILANESQLNYQIYISENGVDYVSIIDRDLTDSNEKNDLNSSKARYVKYLFKNIDPIKISEIILVPKDYSKELNVYINKYEKKIGQVVVGEYSGQYIKNDYDEIINYISNCKKIDGSKLIKKDIEQLKQEIFTQYINFISKSITVTKNELLVNMIESQMLLNKYPDNHENKLFVQLINNLEDAKNVYSTYLINQSRIDNAATALKDTLDTIMAELNVTNKVALHIAIELAQNADLKNVVPIVVKEFNEALTNAQAIYDKTDASQEEIDKAFDRLARAMQMLEFYKGDKVLLQKLVDQITSLTADEYTESTWNTLQAILPTVNEVLVNENAMQDEVDRVYTELVKAFINLRLKPNKDLLEELINKVNSLNAANYTVESWQAVQSASKDAKIIIADLNATIEEINNAEETLSIAISNLREITVENNVDRENKKDSVNTGDNITLFYSIGCLTLSILIIYIIGKRTEA